MKLLILGFTLFAGLIPLAGQATDLACERAATVAAKGALQTMLAETGSSDSQIEKIISIEGPFRDSAPAAVSIAQHYVVTLSTTDDAHYEIEVVAVPNANTTCRATIESEPKLVFRNDQVRSEMTSELSFADAEARSCRQPAPKCLTTCHPPFKCVSGHWVGTCGPVPGSC